MAEKSFGWGIMGLGNIAAKFAAGVADAPGAHIAAVGSRSQEKADEFGARVGAARAYGSYEALVSDPDVDAVYIATPHPPHKDNMLLCIEAGKPVLCEKPFTINAKEAEEAIAAARSRKVFLMEAMWTRFFPMMGKIKELLATGAIGELRMVQAGFGYRAAFNPASRAFDPKLGGGGLLDVGVYPISLTSWLFGTPTGIAGFAHLGESGVDEQCAIVLNHANGELALLNAAVSTVTPHEAILSGTDGEIRIHDPWWKPAAITLTRNWQPERIEIPYLGNGYAHEAIEVMECVRAGRLESAVMPLDETLEIMRTMDALRAQWGLKYPME
jgi:predicted dehydrogenase